MKFKVAQKQISQYAHTVLVVKRCVRMRTVAADAGEANTLRFSPDFLAFHRPKSAFANLYFYPETPTGALGHETSSFFAGG